ncbi:MAG: type II toxin-antitoxin system RelE/ParE family toxin [Nanoarchaeota archaeon]
MVEIRFDKKFVALFSKLKDPIIKHRISVQIKKTSENPEVGKPMMHTRTGTRELYVSSFRLSYEYFKNKEIVYILDLYHKDEQ